METEPRMPRGGIGTGRRGAGGEDETQSGKKWTSCQPKNGRAVRERKKGSKGGMEEEE